MNKIGNIIFLEDEIKMPLMQLPVRTTAVRLLTGVVLISPIHQLEKKIAEIQKLGPVTDMSSKRQDIKWNHILTKENWPYNDEMPLIEIKDMPRFNEAVFFHKQSRTLIVTDLLFNLKNPTGIGAWIILKIFGTYKKLGISRLFIKMIGNKKEFKDSLQAVLAWDFDNIVMAHGEIIIGNGKKILLDVLQKKGLI